MLPSSTLSLQVKKLNPKGVYAPLIDPVVDTIKDHVPRSTPGLVKEFQQVAQQISSLLKPEPASKDKRCCVICVGSTGTGKSSTISKCTRRAVASGNGKDRVTFKCDVYTFKKEDEPLPKSLTDLVWVDTVGWDDADLQDDHTFKDILKFIQNEKLLKVKAILWCVLPNVRKDALLLKQARMIDMFKPKEIWHNVVIVCKQSRNPEDDSQGAQAAARDFNADLVVPSVGFTYIEDPSLTMQQKKRFHSSQELRDDFGVRNDEETRAIILQQIRALPRPVQVVFTDSICLDCGAEGDIRLLPPFCHMEMIRIHPGHIIQYHPRLTERYHDSHTTIREHPGGLYRPWYSWDCIMCKLGGDRYICCHSLSGQPGCRLIRSCCQKPFVQGDDAISGCKERYQCCKINVMTKISGCKSKYSCCSGKLKSTGCRAVCKKCDRTWGTTADQCFEKPHTVIKKQRRRTLLFGSNPGNIPGNIPGNNPAPTHTYVPEE